MSSSHYTTKYDDRWHNICFESLQWQVIFTKFLLMKKVITVTVNNTKSSCLYDFNSTGEFPGIYIALCYGTVDCGRKRARKTWVGSNVTSTMYPPFQGSFSMSGERIMLHEGAFHIPLSTVLYSLVKTLNKPHFKDPYWSPLMNV